MFPAEKPRRAVKLFTGSQIAQAKHFAVCPYGEKTFIFEFADVDHVIFVANVFPKNGVW